MCSYFLRFITLISLTLFALSCETSTQNSPSIEQKKHYAILGPLSRSNILIYPIQSDTLLYKTETLPLQSATQKLVWQEYGVGSFDVELDSSIDAQSWLYVEARGGEDVDSDDDGVLNAVSTPLEGGLKLYIKAADFNSSRVVINIFTTIAATLYKQSANSLSTQEYLDRFAQSIFVESLNSDEVIDYRDIFSYVPNHTSKRVLFNPKLYDSLIEQGVAEAILHDANLTQILLADRDGDGVIFWRELLYGSLDSLVDTDSDGLEDGDEIDRGLNPAAKDSDKDGLDDKEEISLYLTNPLLSDSDSDYFPDGVEIYRGSDPLNADENSNAIADGLDADPFLEYQWYVKSYGKRIVTTSNVSTIAGNDLDILDIYHSVVGSEAGKKIVIQVIDSGVEATHEDLDVELSLSYNSINHTNDPSPTQTVDSSSYESPLEIGHGTAVAGIVAARANNGLGIRGIVPNAKIAGSNWLEDESIEELEKVWYSLVNSDAILVSNNSWGAYFLQDEAYEEILKLGSSELRNGKGRIYVFAAGNFREEYGNTNLSYLSNNPYAITVASLTNEDKFSLYSTQGSSILVSAYGGNHYYDSPTILTTLLMGESYYKRELKGAKGAITIDEDSNKNYTYAMNGTSAATPMVSGIIALTLQACPDLSYRDVRWLIAHTAKKIDSTNISWLQNGAGAWYSTDYGYGKIDGVAMLQECSSKYFEPLSTLRKTSSTLADINRAIPDTNSTISEEIVVSEDITIEWVGLTFTSNHPFAGDLEIELISPSGTRVSIMTLTETHFAAYKDGFRFGSVALMGESSKGVWRVEVSDRLEDDGGILNALKLEIEGH